MLGRSSYLLRRFACLSCELSLDVRTWSIPLRSRQPPTPNTQPGTNAQSLYATQSLLIAIQSDHLHQESGIMLRNEAELSSTRGHVRCPVAYTPLWPSTLCFSSRSYFALSTRGTSGHNSSLVDQDAADGRMVGELENIQDLEHDFRPPRFLDFLNRCSISTHTRR